MEQLQEQQEVKLISMDMIQSQQVEWLWYPYIPLGKLTAWFVIVIIAREFIISGFRLVASDNGVVIAASYWGKFKTTFQMLMIIYLVVDLQFAYANVVGMVLVYVALALTVISLVDYIAKNYKVFLEGSSK